MRKRHTVKKWTVRKANKGRFERLMEFLKRELCSFSGVSITSLIIVIVVLFGCGGLYLHQKVLVYTQAYQLSQNHQTYSDLVDERDYLRYYFTQEVSVSKISQWAESNELFPVDKKRILALNLKREQTPASEHKLVGLFNRILGISTATSAALAENKKD